MIIVGAKGFAKEVLEILKQLNRVDNIAFFDDISTDAPELIYDQFPVLKSDEAVNQHFQTYGAEFVLGVGNPKVRQQLDTKFKELGGTATTLISPYAITGSYDNTIGEGSIICTGSVTTNSIEIGNGVLINLNCTIGHDTILNNYVELCPGVNISGGVTIGEGTFIGTNATILPNITIGKNSIVAAGAVVIEHVPDNCMVAGNPAKIKKTELA